MSKAKHTKGKWSVADYGHCIAVEVKLDNGQEHTIMTDQFCHAAKFNGDAMANARLIAEAPTLKDYLSSARVVLARMRRSMMAHPDHEVGSEFDDLTTESQILEDEIMELIRRIEG